MKKLITLILIIYCIQGSGQKIIKNEVDKFSKQKRVETSEVWLSNKLHNRLNVHLRSVGEYNYALFYADGKGAGIINEQYPLIFLLENDSTIKIHPTGLQSYEFGSSQNYYKNHQYNISDDNLNSLSKQTVKSVRVYTSEGYCDYDVKEKDAGKFKDLISLFIKNK
jgi:hypothetical protein